MTSEIAKGTQYLVGRGCLALCIFGLVASERPARAQNATAPPSAAPVTDPAKVEEARRHFQRGLMLLRDPEGEIVEAAYLEFKAAYDLSRSPRVLGNIGYCAMRMERNSESVAAYREYMRLVPDIDATERAQISQDLVTMTDGAATVTVRYSGPVGWTLVDERIPVRAAMVTNTYGGTANEPLTILVHPGHHVFHVKSDGEEQSRWEVEALGGASFSHNFEPKPAAPAPSAFGPAPERPTSRVPQFVTLGVGGALLAASAVTGIVAFTKMKDLEKQCPGDLCHDPNLSNDVSSARTLGTITDTLLVGGGVLVIVGGVWLALSGNRHESAPPPVAFSCTPGGCGATLRGSF